MLPLAPTVLVPVEIMRCPDSPVVPPFLVDKPILPLDASVLPPLRISTEPPDDSSPSTDSPADTYTDPPNST
jgi:hypothetical protein